MRWKLTLHDKCKIVEKQNIKRIVGVSILVQNYSIIDLV